jgi:hypothetical protein
MKKILINGLSTIAAQKKCFFSTSLGTKAERYAKITKSPPKKTRNRIILTHLLLKSKRRILITSKVKKINNMTSNSGCVTIINVLKIRLRVLIITVISEIV